MTKKMWCFPLIWNVFGRIGVSQIVKQYFQVYIRVWGNIYYKQPYLHKKTNFAENISENIYTIYYKQPLGEYILVFQIHFWWEIYIRKPHLGEYTSISEYNLWRNIYYKQTLGEYISKNNNLGKYIRKQPQGNMH